MAGRWSSLRSCSAIQTASCSDGTLIGESCHQLLQPKAGGAKRKLELNGLAEIPQTQLRPGFLKLSRNEHCQAPGLRDSGDSPSIPSRSLETLEP